MDKKFAKLKILVTRKESDEKVVHEFVDGFVNQDHIMTARAHEDNQWILELSTGKSIVVKGFELDKV